MLAGFEDHARGTEQGLRGETRGGVAGQAGGNATVAEGFDHQEGVGGAAAAEAGHGVEERFLELEGEADRSEEALGELGVGGRGGFAGGETGGGRADERGRVGHHADNARALGQGGFEAREGDAGGDGNEEVARLKAAADFREHAGDLVGFDSEEEHVGRGDNLEVRGRGARAGVVGEVRPCAFIDITGDELVGGEEAAVEKAFGQCASHFPRAEEADGERGICHARVVALRGGRGKAQSSKFKAPGETFGASFERMPNFSEMAVDTQEGLWCYRRPFWENNFMYAVVETGGKQYRVSAGDKLEIERLKVEAGKPHTFDRVLLVNNEGKVTIGAPTVAAASVVADVLEHKRGVKVISFKMKRRKGYHKTTGHRQELTVVQIKEIKG